MVSTKAKLILKDGSEYTGYSFGASRNVDGEVVFNTGMVGYPESLTDPSYRGQILVFSYPLIGNYGVPSRARDAHAILRFFESEKIHVQGVVAQNYIDSASHHEAVRTLSSWLTHEGIPAISGIDTRDLILKLRKQGVMPGRIQIDVYGRLKSHIDDPYMRNLVSEVSCSKPQWYTPDTYKKTIILVDCGAKNNILRSLLARNLRVYKVPWDYNFLRLNVRWDGVVISNGPGDPKQCNELIQNIKTVMTAHKPILGICLGNQILALAAGADTYKLKYGHRSHNQPCIDQETGRFYITTQNHGFAVRGDSLDNHWKPWFYNANDATIEGIKHKNEPFLAVQFHPEASPGPEDTGFIFDTFINLL